MIDNFNRIVTHVLNFKEKDDFYVDQKEIILMKHLKRTMLRFNPEEFKRDYPSLYEGIMRAMEDYGDIHRAKGMYEGYKLCEDDKSRVIQPNRY